MLVSFMIRQQLCRPGSKEPVRSELGRCLVNLRHLREGTSWPGPNVKSPPTAAWGTNAARTQPIYLAEESPRVGLAWAGEAIRTHVFARPDCSTMRRRDGDAEALWEETRRMNSFSFCKGLSFRYCKCLKVRRLELEILRQQKIVRNFSSCNYMRLGVF
ncbi:hypothetical protein VTK73DRAFT_5134 [Phialemonium thermophilum]|uniref:Uncharacterized protein n=1 Tax=Phialemonium thermophilum TaxID=223376 RepID=A0ABR3WPV5_9PEZI